MYSKIFLVLIIKLVFKVSVETPETEQPPPLPHSEVSEENVDITKDLQEMPKKQVTEEERNTVSNGDSSAPSPTVTPAPSSTTSPAPTPRSGLNGSLIKETPDRTSVAENPESISPFINGGIINKRYSYSSGSMASESMDMSIHKGNMSMSARVSQDEANLFVLVLKEETLLTECPVNTLICPVFLQSSYLNVKENGENSFSNGYMMQEG